jgi:hypothetical protein
LVTRRDVLDDRDGVEETPGRVAHGRCADVDPDDAAVLPEIAFLQAVVAA